VCGYLVILSKSSISNSAIDRARKILHRRGPDDSDVHCVNVDGFKLTALHTRLAIQSTDKSAAQPKPYVSDPESFFVYNGELYQINSAYAEFTSGQIPAGYSDTRLISEFATPSSPFGLIGNRFGPHSLVSYDSKSKRLVFFRDQYGEKPQFYYNDGSTLIVSSNLFALVTMLQGSHFRYNHPAIEYYFKTGVFPLTETPLYEVNKTHPSTHYRVDVRDRPLIIEPSPKDLPARPLQPDISSRSVIDIFESNVKDCIETSCRDQVILVSSGLDSTSVSIAAANYSRSRGSRLLAVSADFGHGSNHNEWKIARDNCANLSIEFDVVKLSNKSVLDAVSSTAIMNDEPFGNASQVAFAVIMEQLSRNGVSVVLTGDGGDEIFGGYERHTNFQRLNMLLSGARSIHGERVIGLLRKFNFDQFSESERRLPRLFSKFIRNFLARLNGEPDYLAYRNYTGYQPQEPKSGSIARGYSLTDLVSDDRLYYIAEDCAVKLDRASMYHSIETRSPFISKELERSFDIVRRAHPDLGFGTKKKILRSYIENSGYKIRTGGSKKGFSVPLQDWMDVAMNAFEARSELSHYYGDIGSTFPTAAGYSSSHLFDWYRFNLYRWDMAFKGHI
jgi:asparagine synthase (glutamine-hydrolysing)